VRASFKPGVRSQVAVKLHTGNMRAIKLLGMLTSSAPSDAQKHSTLRKYHITGHITSYHKDSATLIRVSESLIQPVVRSEVAIYLDL